MENQNNNKTSMGLQENIAAPLSYVLTFITGIIFFILEKENKFVRFHAMQSIITFLPLIIIQQVVRYIPFIGGLLSTLIGLLQLILWILLIVKSYNKELFKLPIVGDIAEQQANK